MENFIKNLYFDWTLFKAMNFGAWVRLTLSKYKCLFCILVLKKSCTLRAGKNTMLISSIEDLGTTLSSLSDSYYDLKKHISDARIIIDVGANIGQFANAAKYWFPNSKIYSFEPVPEVFEILQQNMKSCWESSVQINFWLSDSQWQITFYTSELSLVSSIIKSDHMKSALVLEVNTLDNMLGDLEDIDILKIDVEWAELMVLKWSANVLKRSKYLLIEMSFERDTNDVKNLDVLMEVRKHCPRAEIFHTGRKLWWRDLVSAQDFLIKLNNL